MAYEANISRFGGFFLQEPYCRGVKASKPVSYVCETNFTRAPKKESGTACQKYLFSSATARKIRKTNLKLNKRERTTKQKWNKCKNHKFLCGCYLWEIFIFFIVSSVGFSILVPYRLLENFTYCCFLIAFYWNLLWRLVCKKKLIWFSFLLFSDCLGLWCRVYARRENSGKGLLLWAVTSDL